MEEVLDTAGEAPQETAPKKSPSKANEFDCNEWKQEIDDEKRIANQHKYIGRLRNAQNIKGYTFPQVNSSEKIDGSHHPINEYEAHLYHVQDCAGMDRKTGTMAPWKTHKLNEEGYYRWLKTYESTNTSLGQKTRVIHIPKEL